MGAFDGQLTYARFQVQGEPPKGFREAYLKAVQLRAFAPLQPEQPEQESVGWCVAGRVFGLSFDYDALYYGDELALGLRVDRWRIPSAVLRAHLTEERLSQLGKRGVERLSRAQQEELKLRVLTRLRKRSLPSMKLMDLVWNLRTGTLRNRRIVDGIFFQAGRRFANGHNFCRVSFTQRTLLPSVGGCS